MSKQPRISPPVRTCCEYHAAGGFMGNRCQSKDGKPTKRGHAFGETPKQTTGTKPTFKTCCDWHKSNPTSDLGCYDYGPGRGSKSSKPAPADDYTSDFGLPLVPSSAAGKKSSDPFVVPGHEPHWHDGSVLCFTTHNGTRLAGGNGRGLDKREDFSDVSVILDLAGVAPRNLTGGFVASNAPARWRGLNRLCGPTVIRLNWTDMQPPPSTVGLRFWRGILSLVPAGGLIVPACIGGHGRTGTALACLALAGNVLSDPDAAIAAVRTLHCPRAIETKAQENYIRRIAAEAARESGNP